MKRVLFVSAVTVAAILGVKEILVRKEKRKTQDYINWLHARCDRYDAALELLMDGESGAF